MRERSSSPSALARASRSRSMTILRWPRWSDFSASQSGVEQLDGFIETIEFKQVLDRMFQRVLATVLTPVLAIEEKISPAPLARFSPAVRCNRQIFDGKACSRPAHYL